ncbi:alpha/beta fold hydrolase [Polymorphospora rubra]|uniref:Hydrolase n=1 Tax=Polymorphospora rubra TaxID=338584 RepID=A0A810N6U7_9ACTN|nr:alpha/beta fold hydrolase [Polymorphospora rubra]BCJ69501.1 hydrolase [Polymorphospora rubra]
MPLVRTNGIRLAYRRSGHGVPVLLIMGSSAGGRVWTVHQTPALNRAGYETITFDNRGVASSDAPAGDYALSDLVADTAGLIEALDLGPCHIVGTSLGAMIAQDLALRRQDLVRSLVLIATRARSDAMRRAQDAGDRALAAAGIRLPAAYRSVKTALEMLSPATLNSDTVVAEWLGVFEISGGDPVPGQGTAVAGMGDRRRALSGITVPCRAIAFTDDLICPPHLVAEVADAIPKCDFVEISDCGHLGYLERPQVVNEAIVAFLDRC